MGFNSVYKSLQEVFPQVDARILKAVAIEHSKDADAAVEFVISEVLPSPSFSPRPRASVSTSSDNSTQNDNISSCSTPRSPQTPVNNLDVQKLTGEDSNAFISFSPQPSASVSTSRNNSTQNDNISSCSTPRSPQTPVNNLDVQNLTCEVHSFAERASNQTKQSIIPTLQWVDEPTNEASPPKPISMQCKDANENDHTGVPSNYTTCLDGYIGVPSIPNMREKDVSEELYARVHDEANVAGCTDNIPCPRIQDLNEQVAYDSFSSVHSEFLQDQPCSNNCQLEQECRITTVLPDSSAVHQESLDFAECASKNESDSSVCEFEKPWSSCSPDDSSEQVIGDSEIVDVTDNTPSTTIVTRSGQICRIDLFEDAIKDAKNNKQTLFLAMETVINMMKEVELQEKSAEQAKEEAARGGLDILARVEDLRQMLQHAKGANDMHSGEIYGEKAILATEVRELQTRLISLSDDRDESLAILDEMSRTLEARLAAAEEMRKSAEKEKDEKEDFARRALAEQELIMDKVVQESKRLQLEAEENSKLREFLVDRGLVVDALQGEIAVICKDVKLLKEKFDERVPISKSLYSSQTSCVLAASASSAKCIASDWIPEEGESAVKSIASDWVADTGRLSDTLKSVSPASSVHDHPQNNTFEDKGIIRDARKELSDDGWDMFDDESYTVEA